MPSRRVNIAAGCPTRPATECAPSDSPDLKSDRMDGYNFNRENEVYSRVATAEIAFWVADGLWKDLLQ